MNLFAKRVGVHNIYIFDDIFCKSKCQNLGKMNEI